MQPEYSVTKDCPTFLEACRDLIDIFEEDGKRCPAVDAQLRHIEYLIARYAASAETLFDFEADGHDILEPQSTPRTPLQSSRCAVFTPAR